MCTVIVAHKCYESTPLLVAANRDEELTRPFTGPTLRPCGERMAIAPTDTRAGGTWMGLNSAGAMAAITNRFVGSADPERRSRGELVLAALAHDSSAAGASAVASLDPCDYNPFHLVLADRTSAWVVRHEQSRLVAVQLPPGVHVITERSFDAAPTARDGWLVEQTRRWGCNAPDDAALARLLSTHGEPTTERPCVHLDSRGYGTRSSSILRFGRAVDDVTWSESPGPPCRSPHEAVDLDGILRLRGAQEGHV